MARRHRFHSPTSTYHIMLRGNDGQPIFFSEADRSRMCLLLQEGMERFGHRIEAFCFMSNHIHLAIQVADISISRIIHHLAFRYTRYINRLYKRMGHLFQGRFKSILIDDVIYLKELIRYIHLNPVRAGIVSNPEHYFWSSHRAYIDLDEFVWLFKNRVLEKFHHEREDAIKNYQKYVFKGIGIETEYDFKSGYTQGMLGNQEFIEEILVSAECSKQKVELSDLIAKVCNSCNLNLEELISLKKLAPQSHARALLALLVRESKHLSLVDLGKLLRRDPSGLTKLANRLELKSASDADIRSQLQEIRDWILNLRMSECQA